MKNTTKNKTVEIDNYQLLKRITKCRKEIDNETEISSHSHGNRLSSHSSGSSQGQMLQNELMLQPR